VLAPWVRTIDPANEAVRADSTFILQAMKSMLAREEGLLGIPAEGWLDWTNCAVDDQADLVKTKAERMCTKSLFQ